MGTIKHLAGGEEIAKKEAFDVVQIPFNVFKGSSSTLARFCYANASYVTGAEK